MATTPLAAGTYNLQYRTSPSPAGWFIQNTAAGGTPNGYTTIANYSVTLNSVYTFRFQTTSSTSQYMAGGFQSSAQDSGFQLSSGSAATPPASNSPLANSNNSSTLITESIALLASTLLSPDPKIKLGGTTDPSTIFLTWSVVNKTNTWLYGSDASDITSTIPNDGIPVNSSGTITLWVQSTIALTNAYASFYTALTSEAGTVLASARMKQTGSASPFYGLQFETSAINNSEGSVNLFATSTSGSSTLVAT